MRPKRIEYVGAIYHVMQRGNNKEIIFRGDMDKQFYMAELANSKKMFDFQLYGYALLDNHYHLLLQTGEIHLSKIMQRLNSLYSRYYNRVHERSGHLFGIRYKASIINDERYLLAVLRYIHWNPVRAGICRTVSEYKWSSDVYYRNDKTGLINTNFILNSISKNHQFATNEYLRLIQDDATEEYNRIEELTKANKEQKDEKQKLLDEILLSTGASIEDYKLIKKGSRRRYLANLKKKYAREALKQGYTLLEIANNINLSAAAVHRITDAKIS